MRISHCCHVAGALVLLAWAAGCEKPTQPEELESADVASCFLSPREAVPQISRLLREKNWGALAQYYDLTDSGIDRSELTSGAFFYRTERPAAAHPAGFWRYKHPFAPGFEYDREEPAGKPGVVIVTVAVEIDQGDGRTQRGISQFKMKKHPEGWQILPGPVEP